MTTISAVNKEHRRHGSHDFFTAYVFSFPGGSASATRRPGTHPLWGCIDSVVRCECRSAVQVAVFSCGGIVSAAWMAGCTAVPDVRGHGGWCWTVVGGVGTNGFSSDFAGLSELVARLTGCLGRRVRTSGFPSPHQRMRIVLLTCSVSPGRNCPAASVCKVATRRCSLCPPLWWGRCKVRYALRMLHGR
jgi:hypothetical protein